MGPEALAQVLRPLQEIFQNTNLPDLLVGLNSGDDAAVYKITEDTAVIQTIDFFTPIVDDPYQFGAIAAANAMSDVYAMGGEVILALNVCGFPANLPQQMISEILRGGAEKVAEAGGALAGGHTIIDKEPKYGLSVLGRVHPSQLLKKSGARVGDMLVLTKPLGVGVITTALKKEVAEAAHVNQAVKSMMALNKDASRIIRRAGASACTDITGFSLLGHGYEMAQKSSVRIRLFFNRLPFIEGTMGYAEKKCFPGGACNNERYYKKHVDFDPGIPGEMKMALFTPETSGGLLAAVSKESLEYLTDQFKRRRHPFRIVGEVIEGQGVEVVK
ncbi:MAG: selenide, water dikinase SelD [Candidatus Aminicenantes bacterium]|nr:selenide, water dikinase SelD [Candidatus Aminicenantes bacterium]